MLYELRHWPGSPGGLLRVLRVPLSLVSLLRFVFTDVRDAPFSVRNDLYNTTLCVRWRLYFGLEKKLRNVRKGLSTV